MATTVTFFGTFGEVEVNAGGQVVTVPITRLSHDSDLRETVAQAMSKPGTPVTVPSIARVPRPRHSRVHGILQ